MNDHTLKGMEVGKRQAGKLEGQVSYKGVGEYIWKINGGITSHVFLTLKYDERIPTVGLLLFIGLFVSMGISNDSNL